MQAFTKHPLAAALTAAFSYVPHTVSTKSTDTPIWAMGTSHDF